MVEVLKQWFHKYLSDPQAVVLLVLLVVSFAVVLLMGKMLAPVFAAIVIAFLLEGCINPLERLKVPRIMALVFVFIAFIGISLVTILAVFPLIWHQLKRLFNELPSIIKKGQESLRILLEKFPDYVSDSQVLEITSSVEQQFANFGQYAVSTALTSLPGLVVLLVYFILVPLLVLFFLKDKDVIFDWFKSRLPKDRHLTTKVWDEMNDQIGNYVRGKVVEIIIVGLTTYIVFVFLKLDYAALLSTIVGFSVLVPYIGAAVVTIPIALIAFFQWGWSTEFIYVVVAYGIIQALDGNLLVPLLFSEAVNLHPVAIIIAVLVFGGIWGFWGVFFAIPLATLVKAVINAWPKHIEDSEAIV